MRIKIRDDTWWRIDGTQRWKWEETGSVMVLSVGSVGEDKVEGVVETIRGMFAELNLDLEVSPTKAGQELTRCILDLKKGKALDIRQLVNGVNALRKNIAVLRPGLVILTSPAEFDPFGRPSDKERGHYGESHDDGVCMLRSYGREVVRHELAHMLGLGRHCDKEQSCVMRWSVPSGTFCPSCLQALRSGWEIVREP